MQPNRLVHYSLYHHVHEDPVCAGRTTGAHNSAKKLGVSLVLAAQPGGTGSGLASLASESRTAARVLRQCGVHERPYLRSGYPCRPADTRGAAGWFNGIEPFSGPSIQPAGTLAQAYSLNPTVIPRAGVAVSYISLWPSGSPQPVVSTLNDAQGVAVANAAIVPAGTPSGGVSVFNSGLGDHRCDHRHERLLRRTQRPERQHRHRCRHAG
jgi:hypothetical protein